MAVPLDDFSVAKLYDFRGKVAVITGGGSGIGAMFASAYVQNGAKVYIASRKEKQLKEVADALNQKGPGSCHYVIADVSSRAGCDALAAEIKKRESKIHVLVNNSGATWGAPYDNFPEKEGWDRVLGLNVKSIYYLTAALTDELAKDATADDPGHVINISSMAAVTTTAVGSELAGAGNGLWSYNTSKAAANHLTTLLASTLGPRNICVNAVMPGKFPSKMTAFGYKTAGAAIHSGQPMGRTGIARDMAGVALFLGSAASAHLTGGHLPLDGGATIARLKASL